MPTPKPYTATDGTVTYRVRVRDAAGRSTSETFDTLAAAQRWCRLVEDIGAVKALRERARRDAASEDYVPTFRELFDLHLGRLPTADARTITDYRRLAERHIMPKLGDMPVDLIEREDVAALIRHLTETPALKRNGDPLGRTLSGKTISNVQGLLSATLTTGVHDGFIDRNPCAGLRTSRAREEERRDERFLTHEEYWRLDWALPDAHRPFSRTLVGTGLRWSEATALQIKHLHFEQQSIRVVQAWKRRGDGTGRVLGPPKSRKSRRTVMTPDLVFDAVKPLVWQQPLDAFLFRTRSGGAIHHGYHRHAVWVRACERAKLDPIPRQHDLRHTHASWLIEQGCTLEQVQDQLGHESILTTRKIYGHLMPAMRLQLRDAAQDAMLMSRPTLLEP